MSENINNLAEKFKETEGRKLELEKKKLNRSFLKPVVAGLGSIVVLGALAGAYLSYDASYKKYKSEYDKQFAIVKQERTKEVENEVKQIVTRVSDGSKLVYNLSLFHDSPVDIINKIEQAIYLGKDKLVTNQSFKLANFTEISFSLTTEDLNIFVDLIKKLKKLYSDSFDITGLTDFQIVREEDDDGNLTGKVFYTSDLRLKYLKDPGENLIRSGGENIGDNVIAEKAKYENNEQAYETFKTLIEQLAEKRKSEGKRDLYVTNNPSDDSMFLRTDFKFEMVSPVKKLGQRPETEKFGIYYITPTNTMSDLFQLHGIGDTSDYNTLKQENVKLILITSEDGTKYGLCTKLVKKDEDLTDLEKENDTRVYTEVRYDGEAKDTTIQAFCNLL